jgi:integrase
MCKIKSTELATSREPLHEEIQRLFSCIKEPCRTAVILDAVSGLRVGELLGLKWEDVRFDQLELNVTALFPVRLSRPARQKFLANQFP